MLNVKCLFEYKFVYCVVYEFYLNLWYNISNPISLIVSYIVCPLSTCNIQLPQLKFFYYIFNINLKHIITNLLYLIFIYLYFKTKFSLHYL